MQTDVFRRTHTNLRRGRVLDHGNRDALGRHQPRGVGKPQHEGLSKRVKTGLFGSKRVFPPHFSATHPSGTAGFLIFLVFLRRKKRDASPQKSRIATEKSPANRFHERMREPSAGPNSQSTERKASRRTDLPLFWQIDLERLRHCRGKMGPVRLIVLCFNKFHFPASISLLLIRACLSPRGSHQTPAGRSDRFPSRRTDFTRFHAPGCAESKITSSPQSLLPSPCQDKVGHRREMFSELNTRPGCASVNASPGPVARPDASLEAEATG